MNPQAVFWTMVFLFGAAEAHPVSFKDAISVMAYNEAETSELLTTYTFDPHWAAAHRFLRLETPAGSRQFFLPQLDWLIYRENSEDSQANLYLSGGYGVQAFQNKTVGAWIGDVEADWESRRYYLDAKYQLVGSDGLFFPSVKGRVGVAPYLAGFNELASWLILQAEVRAYRSDRVILTPLLRFFYRNVLLETGVSFQGEWLLNFMVHF